MSAPTLVEHFFRHEYGRLVAVLARRVGVDHVEAVEDAVQSSLMTALEAWTITGLPDNPSAWLHRVASNALTDELRKRGGRQRLLRTHAAEQAESSEGGPKTFLAGDVPDDLLRMLFACCDETIPPASQLVFALKTLCGFSVGEIAHRLFTSEANVYKRLARARAQLRKQPRDFLDQDETELAQRLDAVHRILYLLFTEGHLSSHSELAIRRELCDEAIRLTDALAKHRVASPQTWALLALMHLHSSRMSSRQNDSGGLLLLEEQDRRLWDRNRISLGLSWLARSATGDGFSRYHAEAGIAAEHCLAPSFGETRWKRVIECYVLLERVAPSPIHRLNRAVAAAESDGAQAGLAVLDGFAPPTWLAGSYLWAAVLADLHRRCGNQEETRRYRASALELAPNTAVADLLRRRLVPSGD